MKKLIQTFLPFFIISSQVFAIAGFGLHLDRSMYSVAETTSQLLVDNPAGGEQLTVGNFTHHGFDNGFGIGGYLYIDAIPVIDIDLEGNLLVSPYDFSFKNNVKNIINNYLCSKLFVRNGKCQNYFKN